MVHQIAPSAFKMKKGGGHIFQLSLICTLKAIEVIKKVKKRKKDWVIELRQINTLCTDENPVYGEYEVDENGEAISETTAEVIDSSPFYGESVEDWEGATIKDQNNYYDS